MLPCCAVFFSGSQLPSGLSRNWVIQLSMIEPALSSASSAATTLSSQVPVPPHGTSFTSQKKNPTRFYFQLLQVSPSLSHLSLRSHLKYRYPQENFPRLPGLSGCCKHLYFPCCGELLIELFPDCPFAYSFLPLHFSPWLVGTRSVSFPLVTEAPGSVSTQEQELGTYL